MAFELTRWDVQFTKRGEVYQESEVTKLLAELGPITDLFVISHGWNNDLQEARELYERFFTSLAQTAAPMAASLAGRRFGALQVFWPSKQFADDDLIPGGGAASATAENNASLLSLLEELKKDPSVLGAAEHNPVRDQHLTAAQKLIPNLETSPPARAAFVAHLRTILNPDDAHHDDDGSEEFFTASAETLFKDLGDPVMPPVDPNAGGAAAIGGEGGAAGLHDLLQGVQAAARRLANFTTYYDMKQRAGVVGRVGLSPLLKRIRDRAPNIRFHLIGHSFGGRLVTATANALADNTQGVSLSLLQAAFSHNGLSRKFGTDDRAGAFAGVLANRRVAGPIIITHTKNDKAVGIAYPLASRIARDGAAALGDENDPYGGMGRNGAQHSGADEGQLLPSDKEYVFAPARIFNLRADKFIRNHGDVTGEQVTHAVWSVVQST